MDLQFKPFRRAYKQACMQLFKSNQSRFFTMEEEAEYSAFLDGLKEVDHYFVVTEDNQIIAAGGFAQNNDHVVLTWGMVARDHHKRGVGEYLTSERLRRIAAIYPHETIRIETSQHTAGFYERYRFKVELKSLNGFGEGIDKVIMTRDGGEALVTSARKVFNARLVLEGPSLTLTPLKESDFARLYQVASDPEIWAMHPASDRYQENVFKAFFNGGINSQMAYLISHNESGDVMGSSRYNAPNYEASSIEIGWTFLDRRYWGGQYNAELKHLMIQHAFDTFAKVHFCIGADNYRSISAVKKLGAYHQPEIIDAARPESVIYELTPDTYVGLDRYGQ